MSPSVPLAMLLDFHVTPSSEANNQFVFRHAASGFSFRMGPAPKEDDPMDTEGDAAGRDAEGQATDAGEGEEEVEYAPLELGAAEGLLPEYLKVSGASLGSLHTLFPSPCI